MRALLMAGVIAGVLAGVAITLVQLIEVVPLIHAAEVYETAGQGAQQHGAQQQSAHQHGDPRGNTHGNPGAEAGGTGISRQLGTLGANLLTGIGYGLLLVAGLALARHTGWRTGLLWGLGGFAAFALAPAQGLPPELPGAAAADLGLRQAWWAATAAATAGGLALIFLTRRRSLAALGVALLIAPHAIGAPQPEIHGGSAPEAMAHAFAAATLVANALFWAVLGTAAGAVYGRLMGDTDQTA